MKLLIACDGSANSEAAMLDLGRAGLPERGEAVVLSIADAWPHLGEVKFGQPQPYSSKLLESARQVADAALVEATALATREAERLRPTLPGWSVQGQSTADSPHAAMLRKAEEWKADLIVLGSTGTSLLGRLMLGSVSHAVLTHARCSVRIGRGQKPAAAAGLKLVVGVDGSQGSAAAVAAIAKRHWPDGTHVSVVTAQDAFVTTALPVDGLASSWLLPQFEPDRHWVAQATESAVRQLTDAGLEATPTIVEGDPKRILLDVATQTGADCIFVGAKGLSRLERFLIGSVSTTIAERAPCSVEVVRN